MNRRRCPGNLEGQIAAAVVCRVVAMPNDLPMVRRFDPRLPAARRAGCNGPNTDPGPVPGCDTDIAFTPLTRPSRWIASGQLTSRRLGLFPAKPMLVASDFTGHRCLHLRAGFLDSATRPCSSLGNRAPRPAADGPRFTVPQGISLWGRLFDEGPMLSLGLALEDALGVAGRRPPMAP